MFSSRRFMPKFTPNRTIKLNILLENKIYVRFGVNWCEPRNLPCQLFNLVYYNEMQVNNGHLVRNGGRVVAENHPVVAVAAAGAVGMESSGLAGAAADSDFALAVFEGAVRVVVGYSTDTGFAAVDIDYKDYRGVVGVDNMAAVGKLHGAAVE
jgi:hypothetical protein